MSISDFDDVSYGTSHVDDLVDVLNNKITNILENDVQVSPVSLEGLHKLLGNVDLILRTTGLNLSTEFNELELGGLDEEIETIIIPIYANAEDSGLCLSFSYFETEAGLYDVEIEVQYDFEDDLHLENYDD